MIKGYIYLQKKMIDWEWYKHIPTKTLFIHLLLTANFVPSKYQGHEILPGQKVSGIHALSEQTGLSIQQVRTALKNLKSTNEITIKTTNKFSIITITKWEEYQDPNKQANKQITNEQQTNNNQSTTSEEIKINNKLNTPPISPPKGEVECPLEVSEQVWKDFLKHRKSKKAPVTVTVLKGIEREAKKAGWSMEEALTEICNRDWRGFNSDWVKRKTPQRQNAQEAFAGYEFG